MAELNQVAPDFTLHHSKTDTITLSDLRGQKVVLAFFPAAFTGVCEKEMCAFRDQLSAFNDLNAVVLGVSVDGPFSNMAFGKQHGINFPILSDYSRSVVNAYDLAMENFAGLPGYTASKRAVFIVNEEGIISYKWVGPHPGVEPDYAVVQAALS